MALCGQQALAITQVFTNGFGITNYRCFGTEIANRNNDNSQSDFDICVAGVLTGAVLLIALYPYLDREEDNYGYAYSHDHHGYGHGHHLKRQDFAGSEQQPVVFRNPADSIRDGIEGLFERENNGFNWFSERLSRAVNKFRSSFGRRSSLRPRPHAVHHHEQPAVEEVQQ